MRKLCTLTLAFLFGALFTVNAQDEEMAEESSEGLTISGSVDTYVRGVIGADRDWAPATSFANQNGFAIGMANLVIAKEGAKAGFVADLVYGPRGTDAVFASGPSNNIVNQLYAYWKATDAVTFTLGNFNTFLGYEVISPVGNFNYSTSYMFSYGPFSHTGLRADFSITDEFSAMLAVMNPTDLTEFNPTNSYTLGAQLGYSNDMGSAYLNFIYGDQDGTVNTSKETVKAAIIGGDDMMTMKPQFQVDLTTGWTFGNFFIGLNTTYNSFSGYKFYSADVNGDIEEDETSDAFGYLGVALYPQYSFSDAFALGLRTEYFSEFEGGFGIIGGYDADGSASVIATTLSANVKAGNLTFIPELRIDSFSEDVVPNDDEATNIGVTALLAAVYSF